MYCRLQPHPHVRSPVAVAAPGFVEVLASVGHAGGAREALSERAGSHVHERQARRRVALCAQI